MQRQLKFEGVRERNVDQGGEKFKTKNEKSVRSKRLHRVLENSLMYNSTSKFLLLLRKTEASENLRPTTALWGEMQ